MNCIRFLFVATFSLVVSLTAHGYAMMFDATTAQLHDGRVLVFGGKAVWHPEIPADSVQIYEPNRDEWSNGVAMPSSHIAHAGLLLSNGKYFVAGGVEQDKASDEYKEVYTKAAAVYDPNNGLWNSIAPMNHRRKEPSAVQLEDGRVFVSAGTRSPRTNEEVLADEYCQSEIYDFNTNKWVTTAMIPACDEISNFGIKAYKIGQNKVLTVSTFGFHTRIYDATNNTWTEVTPYSRGVKGSSGRFPSGDIYFADTNDSEGKGALYRFNQITLEWEVVSRNNPKRAPGTLMGLDDGRLVLYGEDDSWFGGIIYDFNSSQWVQFHSMESSINVWPSSTDDFHEDELHTTLVNILGEQKVIIFPHSWEEIVELPKRGEK